MTLKPINFKINIISPSGQWLVDFPVIISSESWPTIILDKGPISVVSAEKIIRSVQLHEGDKIVIEVLP